MKNNIFIIFLITFALMLLIIDSASAQTTERNVNWDLVGKNLVVGVNSGNPGVQQAAMRLIIQYAEKLNVDDAERGMMRIYRFSDDSKNLRQLIR